jgi:hypothetical protein
MCSILALMHRNWFVLGALGCAVIGCGSDDSSAPQGGTPNADAASDASVDASEDALAPVPDAVADSNGDGSETGSRNTPWIAAKVDGNDSSSFLASKNVFETWLGRPMDAFIGFTSMEHWSTPSGEFIAMNYSKGLYAALGIPVIWQIALCPNDESTTNYLTEVDAGSHDAEFEKAAESLADFRLQDEFVYVRLGHEFNGNWYSWGQKKIAGVENANGVQPEDFVAAFRHVVDIFRSHSTRFRFVWNPTLQFGAGADVYAESFYPGDDYADVISFDIYWDTPTSSDPAKFFTLARDAPAGLDWHADFAALRGKPIAFDEWGAHPDGGPFVDAMAAWFLAHPPLWHGYWDSNSGYVGKISDGLSGTTGERYEANFGP